MPFAFILYANDAQIMFGGKSHMYMCVNILLVSFLKKKDPLSFSKDKNTQMRGSQLLLL